MIGPDVLLPLPLALSLGLAVLTLLLGPFRRALPWISMAGMTLLLGAAVLVLQAVGRQGVVVSQMGGWPAPFGITLVADHLSALFLVMTALVGLAVSVYARRDVDATRVRHGFYPLLHLLVGGVCGAFLTGDLFNLYVWFEVLLAASFILMALGNTPRQLAGTLPYVVLSLIGSTLFLGGIGVLYGMTGTLNLADLAGRVAEVGRPGLMTAVAFVFVVAFGLKAAAVPFHLWLPEAYPAPPPAIGALLAGLLTKVGVYALLRLFTLVFTHAVGTTHTVLLWIAAATMLLGALSALAQPTFRRLLAFQLVATIGFMLMGLGLYTRLGLAGAIFYAIEDIVVITTLFLLSGLIERRTGTEVIDRMGGLYQHTPALAVAYLIPALSIAGFPPLSGFWAKFILARAGVASEHFMMVAVLLVAGLLTMVVFARVWRAAFLQPAPDDAPEPGPPPGWSLWTPVAALATVTVVISLLAGPVFTLAERAADDLLNPEAYVEAVLGPDAPRP